MRKFVFIAVLAALAAGCTSQPAKPYHVEGTENMVMVNWANSRVDGAMAEADKHCSKFGKRAQFAGNVQDFTIAFNCVK